MPKCSLPSISDPPHRAPSGHESVKEDAFITERSEEPEQISIALHLGKLRDLWFFQERGLSRERRGCRSRARFTSLGDRRWCHWAMGRRAWASMSAQCCRGWPEALGPRNTLPTGSARSCRPRAQTASTRSTLCRHGDRTVISLA